MNEDVPPQGIEPIAEARQAGLPEQPRVLRPGIEMIVHGRTIQLRRLRQAPRGILFWLSILGPGLVAGAVGDDAGGIATYSQAGAQYGYRLLWVIVLITISLAVVQEMSARLGAATGRGLLGLIRSQFGIGWAMFAALIVLLANFGLILGEFVGISSAMALFGVSRYLSVGLAAFLICFLVVAGSYNRVEKIFMVMAAVFLTYIISAVIAHPNPAEILRGMFVPTVQLDAGYITLMVALIGTTISPYQQVFQQSAVVERGISRHHYTPERWDTFVGMLFSNVISLFIIIATAATLHQAGKTNINTAADAARALQPVAGSAAGVLFAIGIVGASLMAATVVSLSSSFAFTDAFGLQQGISQDLRGAPVFYGLFLAQVILAAVLSLIPSIPAFQLLVWVQVLNGVLFPVLLVFILLLANNPRLMDDLKNNRTYNILGWGTLLLTGLAIVLGFALQVFSMLGIPIHFLSG